MTKECVYLRMKMYRDTNMYNVRSDTKIEKKNKEKQIVIIISLLKLEKKHLKKNIEKKHLF